MKGADVSYIGCDEFGCPKYDELEENLKPNTKAVFGETIANPALTIFDFELWAKAAHDNKDFEWVAQYLIREIKKKNSSKNKHKNDSHSNAASGKNFGRCKVPPFLVSSEAQSLSLKVKIETISTRAKNIAIAPPIICG